MAEVEQSKPSRVWRMVLIGSLALNVAVAGLVGGAIFRDRSGSPHASYDTSFGPLGRAMSAEDRRAVGRLVRDRRPARGGDRRDGRVSLQGIAEAVQQTPFDKAAFNAALDGAFSHNVDLRKIAQEALADHIATMSPEDRALFAERLTQRRR